MNALHRLPRTCGWTDVDRLELTQRGDMPTCTRSTTPSIILPAQPDVALTVYLSRCLKSALQSVSFFSLTLCGAPLLAVQAHIYLSLSPSHICSASVCASVQAGQPIASNGLCACADMWWSESGSLLSQKRLSGSDGTLGRCAHERVVASSR